MNVQLKSFPDKIRASGFNRPISQLQEMVGNVHGSTLLPAGTLTMDGTRTNCNEAEILVENVDMKFN